MLARCRAPNITEYYASVLKPGTTQLLIVMELMAASAADLVRHGARPTRQLLLQPTENNPRACRVQYSGSGSNKESFGLAPIQASAPLFLPDKR